MIKTTNFVQLQKIHTSVSLTGLKQVSRLRKHVRTYVRTRSNVTQSCLERKKRKREREKKIVQTDSIERSQRCLVTRVRLRNGCASHSHRIRTICNGLNRCVALFVLRKRERTARKYDFSPVVIESNTAPPFLFLPLPLLPCREHELFGIVDNVITAIYLRSLY